MYSFCTVTDNSYLILTVYSIIIYQGCIIILKGECSQVIYFEDLQEYCSPAWSSSVEDTGTYGINWRLGGYEDVHRKSTAWRYTEEANSNSSMSFGKL